MDESYVCGNCIYFEKGYCVMSGWIGCEIDDLATVKVDDKACESFDWSELDE